jgi:S-adenosylmethionine-dependent methyltransferase
MELQSMTLLPGIFDNSISQWVEEQQQPWGRLKYKLIHANLSKHLAQEGPLRVLDAGGGNGLDTLFLAEQGHVVDLVDYSQEMLEHAAQRAAEVGLEQQIQIHEADLAELPNLFGGIQFDVVLCHHVVQYVEDVRSLLESLVALLKPGGILSLVTINRYSIPYHAAFLRRDLTEALALVGARTVRTYIFDAEMTTYSAEEIADMLMGQGCAIEGDYGIRCICDYWGNNELKSDPAILEQIERLEFALTDKFPYKLLARNLQVIARKL